MKKTPTLARPGPAVRLALLGAAVLTSSLTLVSQFLLAGRYDEAASLAARTAAPVAQAPAASQAQPRL